MYIHTRSTNDTSHAYIWKSYRTQNMCIILYHSQTIQVQRLWLLYSCTAFLGTGPCRQVCMVMHVAPSLHRVKFSKYTSGASFFRVACNFNLQEHQLRVSQSESRNSTIQQFRWLARGCSANRRTCTASDGREAHSVGGARERPWPQLMRRHSVHCACTAPSSRSFVFAFAGLYQDQHVEGSSYQADYQAPTAL